MPCILRQSRHKSQHLLVNGLLPFVSEKQQAGLISNLGGGYDRLEFTQHAWPCFTLRG